MAKFQVELAGEWKDYARDEDKILKRAFLAGFPNCKFTLRGATYEYNFRRMVQKNLTSGKERKIRAPHRWQQPARPIVPQGPTICVQVPPGSPGTTIQVKHPKAKGVMINVAVPRSAKVGQAMMVPVPDLAVATDVSVTGGVFAAPAGHRKGKGKGSGKGARKGAGKGSGGSAAGAGAAVAAAAPTPAAVAAADADTKKKEGWSTGAKVAAGTAAVAAVGGGAFLAAHAATEGPDATGEMLADGAEDVGEWFEGAAEDVGDWAEDAGIVDAAEDVAEWTVDAAEDAGEWISGAAEDAGDFIMDLF